MNEFNGYAVFFFPQALEALGEAIKPYLQDSPGGPHVLCREVDAGGALIQLILEGRTTDSQSIDLELMLPTNMVRMIVSARSDPRFGFGPRTAVEPAHAPAPVVRSGPGPVLAPGEQAGAGKAPAQPAGPVPTDAEPAASPTPAPQGPAAPPRPGKPGKKPA